MDGWTVSVVGWSVVCVSKLLVCSVVPLTLLSIEGIVIDHLVPPPNSLLFSRTCVMFDGWKEIYQEFSFHYPGCVGGFEPRLAQGFNDGVWLLFVEKNNSIRVVSFGPSLAIVYFSFSFSTPVCQTYVQSHIHRFLRILVVASLLGLLNFPTTFSRSQQSFRRLFFPSSQYVSPISLRVRFIMQTLPFILMAYPFFPILFFFRPNFHESSSNYSRS